VYELFVRRTNLVRFLMGMKPKETGAGRAASPAPERLNKGDAIEPG
jgi:hypothetical protein